MITLSPELWKKAEEIAVERWCYGSSDTTQMLLSMHAAVNGVLPEYRRQVLIEAIDAAVSKYENRMQSHPEVATYNQGITDARLAIFDLLDGEPPVPDVKYGVEWRIAVTDNWVAFAHTYDTLEEAQEAIERDRKALLATLQYRVLRISRTVVEA